MSILMLLSSLWFFPILLPIFLSMGCTCLAFVINCSPHLPIILESWSSIILRIRSRPQKIRLRSRLCRADASSSSLLSCLRFFFVFVFPSSPIGKEIVKMIDVIGRLETVDTFSKVIFNGVIIIKEASPKSEYLTIDPIINVLSPGDNGNTAQTLYTTRSMDRVSKYSGMSSRSSWR